MIKMKKIVNLKPHQKTVCKGLICKISDKININQYFYFNTNFAALSDNVGSGNSACKLI